MLVDVIEELDALPAGGVSDGVGIASYFLSTRSDCTLPEDELDGCVLGRWHCSGRSEAGMATAFRPGTNK